MRRNEKISFQRNCRTWKELPDVTTYHVNEANL